jgi:3-polyprenyl-4-hydroxybenzoate decarboxylase
MTDKERKTKKEEIFHDLVKDAQRNEKAVGSVDSADMQALGNILKTRLKHANVHGVTAKELVQMQRVVASDTGADPTQAMREIKKQMENAKKRRRR